MNNNKLINEKLICAFRWSVLPSIMKMHGPKNKKKNKKKRHSFITAQNFDSQSYKNFECMYDCEYSFTGRLRIAEHEIGWFVLQQAAVSVFKHSDSTFPSDPAIFFIQSRK